MTAGDKDRTANNTRGTSSRWSISVVKTFRGWGFGDSFDPTSHLLWGKNGKLFT